VVEVTRPGNYAEFRQVESTENGDRVTLVYGGMRKPKPKAVAEIIVRRGALRRFDRLTRDASNVPVEVTWDRRVSDADAPPRAERRGKPPFTWDTADFVVVEKPKRRRRKPG
jgi:hypothetical protein